MVVLVDIRPLEGANHTLQFLSSFAKRMENALLTHQCHCCGLRGPCPACQVSSCPPSRSWHRHPYIKDTSLLIIGMCLHHFVSFLAHNLRGIWRLGWVALFPVRGPVGADKLSNHVGLGAKQPIHWKPSSPAHIFKDGYFNNKCSARHLQPQTLLLAHRVRRRACSLPMAK